MKLDLYDLEIIGSIIIEPVHTCAPVGQATFALATSPAQRHFGLYVSGQVRAACWLDRVELGACP